jgi:hypothetical protein
MLDQHRRRGHFALYAIITGPAVVARNKDIFPIAFDDIHFAIRIVATPLKDDGLRGRAVVEADLEAGRRGRDEQASPLLGFPVLNQAGRFTIDTKNRQLIFD